LPVEPLSGRNAVCEIDQLLHHDLFVCIGERKHAKKFSSTFIIKISFFRKPLVSGFLGRGKMQYAGL
jgi:hypothetical protein